MLQGRRRRSVQVFLGDKREWSLLDLGRSSSGLHVRSRVILAGAGASRDALTGEVRELSSVAVAGKKGSARRRRGAVSERALQTYSELPEDLAAVGDVPFGQVWLGSVPTCVREGSDGSSGEMERQEAHVAGVVAVDGTRLARDRQMEKTNHHV